MPVSIEDIRAAARALEGAIVKTPLVPAPRLSERLGAELFLKLESLQYTGSFKDRGAFNKLRQLSEAERKAGVIAASAGNHAQGVAYHARRLGIPATIVMPVGTPFTKIERTEALGARVVLEGDSLAAAADAAKGRAEREGLIFVHPYDDAAIIAGQGTIAIEMLEGEPELDALVVPVGGGGLISGIAVAANALRPETAVYGVEAESCASMFEALRGGAFERAGSTLAEGIAVERPGKLTEPVVRELVREIFLAGEDAIERAVQTLLTEAKVLAEGAGAAPFAAVEANRGRFAGKKVGLVVSGGNIDSQVLSSILLRGLVREGRMVRLRIELPDEPGALRRVAGIVGDSGANIIEVYHQRLFSDVPIKHAELDLVMETRSIDHAREIMERLAQAGFKNRMLSSRAGDGGE
jgi:threonine dehydratase